MGNSGYVVIVTPMFVLDKASCVCFIENKSCPEYDTIQELHVSGASYLAETGFKHLLISEKVAGELTRDYRESAEWRVDALLEASDHKQLIGELDEADELMKLASMYSFEKNLPTYIVVNKKELSDELANRGCAYGVLLLSNKNDILEKYKHIR